ncbi:K+/H+ antiporter subunit F [Cereibacter azotoformans]|uniref:Multisubunit potassium/proton antiporter PhaF subunit n=2 Tax=Cereibacter TaxID=1653176 RepID=A0A2T5K5R2_9RHOB|nr:MULTISPECIES: K+/H+ antiporter subunit F [Cereibacter]AXQ95587.1 K+/H+ antiporter subunit F [Cereibacter sphaeroides]PTR17775.1 multisubunit potassium/proton antiporter PhaF subunit [Cereibacter azotoformans]UIJ32166.1 K+/H+ antiporter subunit F [Cereibacter azotoformans]ULB11943.1 K+/H+ antiporter subunit F [Cereibacter azotoformans]
MSATILAAALTYAQAMLGIAACLACWRTLRGPRAQDRVLGLDTLYVTAMLFFVVTGMRMGTTFFFEASLVIGVLGFVATVSLAKFLIRGEIIE